MLGSVLDAALVAETIRSYGIETIYHAAAYKHVPIVELNPIVGLTNNTFGAAVLAECASALGVERVVLISTDKAVRPTNVMGASKRLSELVLQAKAAEGSRTVFTMVRFGNVLDSSGSVVRLFRKQIKAGGPVTVTHADIERYFMSIPEAAELVIQAGAMATGGEVFVLHMGEPVKIDDLARLMIHLSGLEVRDKDNPDGDIEIAYTGLRPGEKLYEELLIGARTTGTEHPRILRSDEPFLPAAELKRELEVLRAAMEQRDVAAIQAVLMRTVEGYQPSADELEQSAAARAAWVPPSRTLALRCRARRGQRRDRSGWRSSHRRLRPFVKHRDTLHPRSSAAWASRAVHCCPMPVDTASSALESLGVEVPHRRSTASGPLISCQSKGASRTRQRPRRVAAGRGDGLWFAADGDGGIGRAAREASGAWLAWSTACPSKASQAARTRTASPSRHYARAFKASHAIVVHNHDDARRLRERGVVPEGLPITVVAGRRCRPGASYGAAVAAPWRGACVPDDRAARPLARCRRVRRSGTRREVPSARREVSSRWPREDGRRCA